MDSVSNLLRAGSCSFTHVGVYDAPTELGSGGSNMLRQYFLISRESEDVELSSREIFLDDVLINALARFLRMCVIGGFGAGLTIDQACYFAGRPRVAAGLSLHVLR